jgi:CheY-like chemotaxis protein
MKNRHTILIVDDDTDDREIMRDAFTTIPENNHEYVFIENGDKLIEYLEQCDATTLPSLIILDLNMPGKDGREALKEIKAHEEFRIVPVIVFTTSSSQRDKLTSYILGANCFITKPDTFNKLVEFAGSVTTLWLSQRN